MPTDLPASMLKLTSLILVGFGLIVALGAHPATALPATLLADLVFWPFDGANSLAAAETRVFAAISGGVMVGWGTMMWLLVSRLVPTDPALARLLLIEGALAWFVVDSTGSYASGAILNVALNVVLLLAIVVPAWKLTDHPRIAAA